jgi:hypothetical protein
MLVIRRVGELTSVDHERFAEGILISSWNVGVAIGVLNTTIGLIGGTKWHPR